MKYIKLVMLEQAEACTEQRRRFKSTFGTKAELTTANMAKAIKAGLYFDWLARLLTQPMRKAYNAQHALLWKAYKSQEAPLWEAYEAQYVPLWEAYKAQSDPLWEVYEAKRSPLWKAYKEKQEPLWEAYVAQLNTLLLNTLLAA